MSIYIMASIRIDDPERYAKYQDGFLEIFERYDGEILAVSDTPAKLEGEWPYTRAVILRFPDEEQARRWYTSPEYQAIAEHRWAASEASIVAMEGFDPEAGLTSLEDAT